VGQNAQADYNFVVDRNVHLERHFTFVAVTYWERLPELFPGLFENPADSDAQAYAAVRVFVPRSRLVWQFVRPTDPNYPIGGVPGEFPQLPPEDYTASSVDTTRQATEPGRWVVGRQGVPTHWDLWNQHWSCRLVPATQEAIPQILETPPPLPEFAQRGMTTPNLGGLTGDDLRQINTH
jgi:hypothetical protein